MREVTGTAPNTLAMVNVGDSCLLIGRVGATTVAVIDTKAAAVTDWQGD